MVFPGIGINILEIGQKLLKEQTLILLYHREPSCSNRAKPNGFTLLRRKKRREEALFSVTG
jgi:hypothetical protein